MSTSPRSSRAGRRAGFSLLEIMMVLALMSILFVAALGGVSQGAQTVNESLATDTMRREAIQALNKIANDLKATDRGSVSVFIAGPRMTLVKGTGWTSGGGQTWDPIPHEYSVSNGKLVLSYVGSPQTLASDVLTFEIRDPATGSAFVADQTPLPPTTSTLTFGLTLQRQIGVNRDGSPHLVTVTANRTIFVRANL